MSDNSQYLRPLFTQRLFEKLKNGDSVNLIGGRGTGCDRALADLQQMAEAEGIPVILMNMQQYAFSPDAFSRAVWEQIHQDKPYAGGNETAQLPDTKALAALDSRMPMMISEILVERTGKPSHLFLLLDNFHKILDNFEQRFPRKFFDDLNSLKNRPHISICCVTEKSHLLYKIHIPDGQQKIHTSTSWLNLNPLELPRLRQDEIRAELTRLMKEIVNWQKETQVEIIVDAISKHDHPLELAALLRDHYHFNDGEMAASVRLKEILKNFAEQVNKRAKTKWLSWESIIGKIKDISEIWKNMRNGK